MIRSVSQNVTVSFKLARDTEKLANICQVRGQYKHNILARSSRAQRSAQQSSTGKMHAAAYSWPNRVASSRPEEVRQKWVASSGQVVIDHSHIVLIIGDLNVQIADNQYNMRMVYSIS